MHLYIYMDTKRQREQDQSDEKFLSDVREWMNTTSRAGQTWREPTCFCGVAAVRDGRCDEHQAR